MLALGAGAVFHAREAAILREELGYYQEIHRTVFNKDTVGWCRVLIQLEGFLGEQ